MQWGSTIVHLATPPPKHFVFLSQNLIESQFDKNVKFKEKINEKSSAELRFLPIGRDKDGLAYWYMLDKEHSLQVYREAQDDVDAETWELVCKYVSTTFSCQPHFGPTVLPFNSQLIFICIHIRPLR